MVQKLIHVHVLPGVFGPDDYPGNDTVRSLVADQTVKRVIVLVHGYNTTQAEAQHVFGKMMVKICENLSPKVQAETRFLCLTWDSSCNHLRKTVVNVELIRTLPASVPGAFMYVADIDRVTFSSRGFFWLLNSIANEGKDVHLVGHSMGCQAVLTYLETIAEVHDNRTSAFFGGNQDQGSVSHRILSRIKTVFLLAPDVPTHRIREFFRGYYPIFRLTDGQPGLDRFIFISSSSDLIIGCSELFRAGSDRAGLPDNIDNCLNSPEFLDSHRPAHLQALTAFAQNQYRNRGYPPLELYDIAESALFGHATYHYESCTEIIGISIQEAVTGRVAPNSFGAYQNRMTHKLNKSFFVNGTLPNPGQLLLYWKRSNYVLRDIISVPTAYGNRFILAINRAPAQISRWFRKLFWFAVT